MSQNKYLIFDFDGVIADTWEATSVAGAQMENISVEASKKRNLEYSSRKPNHTRDHTMTDEEMAGEYAWVHKFGLIMADQQFNLFDAFVAEIEKIDTEFKAIVSSGAQAYILPAIAHTKINPTHVLAFENHHSKEEKIETICTDWGIEPSEAHYFTDTLADVYELQNLLSEDKLIGVSWGYCGKELLKKALKDEHILSTPADIHKLLVS